MDRYDIIRNIPWQKEYEKDYPVYLYSGSGRSGACFDEYGLMNPEFISWVRPGRRGNTVWMHADHFIKGNFGLQHHVPVGRFHFDGSAPVIEGEYYQQLHLADSSICTEYLAEGVKYVIQSQFNPENRDVLAMEIAHSGEGKARSIVFTPETDYSIQYDNTIHADAQSTLLQPDLCRVSIRIQDAETIVFIRLIPLKGTLRLQCGEKGLCAVAAESAEAQYALIAAAGRVNREKELYESVAVIDSEADYREFCCRAWAKRWGDARISIPDQRLESFWYRSVYNILCTYSPDADCIAPPNGWNGNGWGFHFPQDFSYIVPALLRLGHTDIAKAKVEFYHRALGSVKEVTRRIYGTNGAMWCWEFPIDPEFSLYEEEQCPPGTEVEARGVGSDGKPYAVPNYFQFEIHNAAYPARMAYETSLHLKDDKWSREIAWEIVKASADFYNDALKKNDTGKWSICITPSMGQDENGGHNERNYLCSLYSAAYTLKIAVRMAEQLHIPCEDLNSWKHKLSDGLAFDRLVSPTRGIYLSSEKLAQGDVLSHLKHPVMLNPLTFLPLMELVDERVLKAYEIKEDLCPDTKQGISPGWTLAAFWLAASHLGKGDDMVRYMHRMREFHYTDKEEIQITESSLLHWMQYYTTSHGLFLQALTDALVSDYDGTLRIGHAVPSDWTHVSYQNLHTIMGCFSGEI